MAFEPKSYRGRYSSSRNGGVAARTSVVPRDFLIGQAGIVYGTLPANPRLRELLAEVGKRPHATRPPAGRHFQLWEECCWRSPGSQTQPKGAGSACFSTTFLTCP